MSGTLVERHWSLPVRVRDAVAAKANDTVCSAAGHWNHCDVWLRAPLAWYTSAVQLILFGINAGIRVRLATVALDVIARADGDAGAAMTRPLGARGVPCDGFEVMVTGFAGSLAKADVILECWGCDDAGGSTTGIGGGAVTDADALPNPTATEMLAFPHVFNGTTWDRWYGTIALGGRVNETQMPVAENNTDGVIFDSPRAIASATGAWSLFGGQTAVGTAGISVKASAGRLRQWRAHNTGGAGFYMAVVNKASAPVAADNIVDRVWVPNGTTGVLEYGSDGLYLSTGIGLAFSTTANTVTLLVANDALHAGRYL